jgi:dolichol-phosphate mannosyltransferase
MKTSIIVPTYNESDGILTFLRGVQRAIPPGFDYEVLVVDDNSPDGTAAVVERGFHQDPRIRVVRREGVPSLGKSIASGVAQAAGEMLVVMDADFAHDPLEIPRMCDLARTHDLVTGSRFCAGGGMENRFHFWQSKLYSAIVAAVLGTPVRDTLSGYFCIGRSTLHTLPCERIFFGYGDYFFRLLYFARRQGLSVTEIPIRYISRRFGKSKSNRLRLVFSYTRALVQLRLV